MGKGRRWVLTSLFSLRIGMLLFVNFHSEFQGIVLWRKMSVYICNSMFLLTLFLLRLNIYLQQMVGCFDCIANLGTLAFFIPRRSRGQEEESLVLLWEVCLSVEAGDRKEICSLSCWSVSLYCSELLLRAERCMFSIIYSCISNAITFSVTKFQCNPILTSMAKTNKYSRLH